jgi:hypothetical protein
MLNVIQSDIVSGCTSVWADNYNEFATIDDGSCELTACPYSFYIEYDSNYTIGDVSLCQIWIVEGCTNNTATNYNLEANVDDGSCSIIGCMDLNASNYNPEATIEDVNSCVIYGCTNLTANNFNVEATNDDGSCIIYGCTLAPFSNYNAQATIDDGSCSMSVESIYGCTDLTALNFNSQATEDNGSCEYFNNSQDCNEGFEITLVSGWNLIGYSCTTPMDVDVALAPIFNYLIIAKDNNGLAYLPEWNYNGIGDFVGGYGYQLKITEQINNFNICE